MDRQLILLAEDNADDEALALRALGKHMSEVEVVVVRNGIEVMDFLQATGSFADRDPVDLPKLLLLDLKMPMMDGLETLKRIRETRHARYLPVVILTSSDELQDRIEGYRLGANSYVRKPVKFDEFVEATRQLGSYWLYLNEVPPQPRN